MDQSKQIESKICKNCNADKETSKFRAYYKECKQWINKKDATDRMRLNKLYYPKPK